MKYDPALFGDFSGSASLRTASIFSSMLSGCQDLLRRFEGAVLARIVSRADHSADRGIIQLLKALLQKDPSKRPSARKSFKALYTTASQSLSLSMSAEVQIRVASGLGALSTAPQCRNRTPNMSTLKSLPRT